MKHSSSSVHSTNFAYRAACSLICLRVITGCLNLFFITASFSYRVQRLSPAAFLVVLGEYCFNCSFRIPPFASAIQARNLPARPVEIERGSTSELRHHLTRPEIRTVSTRIDGRDVETCPRAVFPISRCIRGWAW